MTEGAPSIDMDYIKYVPVTGSNACRVTLECDKAFEAQLREVVGSTHGDGRRLRLTLISEEWP